MLNLICNVQPYEQKIYLYSNNSHFKSNVTLALDALNIKYESVNSIKQNDSENLYIIFDLFTIHESMLPKYYICYQTLDLNSNNLNNEYLKKLSNAIAVWDYSQENINKYRSKVYNYLYYPNNYEFVDPVVLPCILPISTLNKYKELLIYSNQKDTDISSHLPTLFCIGIEKNPKIIVECGVRGGESTQAFREIIQHTHANIIGIDITPNCAAAYSNIPNSLFLCMNDLDFGNYYENSTFKDSKIDMVFIDTSHLYEHTLAEIKLFDPMLSNGGLIIFHDSNVTPLNNGTTYIRLNGTSGFAVGNTKGVTQAIKEFLSLSFDESKYLNTTCIKNEYCWQIIHYPFCNGLTILKKQNI